jgi:tRNA threonylcarbamoyladenosine biosynthesis protein TsaE
MYISTSEGDTAAFAEDAGRRAAPGDVYCLCGPMGAGKTVFARGFAKGLQSAEPAASPTFALMRVHEDGRLPLYHFDLYRLIENGALAAGSLDDIGLEERLDAGGVCLIEWGEYAAGILPPETYFVNILPDGCNRVITVERGACQ